jgi:hypothetical protein
MGTKNNEKRKQKPRKKRKLRGREGRNYRETIIEGGRKRREGEK